MIRFTAMLAGMRVIVALLAFLIVAPAADACSMVRSYIPPTNFELVVHAKLIAVVKVLSIENYVGRFEVREPLVGAADVKELSLPAVEGQRPFDPEFSRPPHPPGCVWREFGSCGR